MEPPRRRPNLRRPELARCTGGLDRFAPTRPLRRHIRLELLEQRRELGLRAEGFAEPDREPQKLRLELIRLLAQLDHLLLADAPLGLDLALMCREGRAQRLDLELEIRNGALVRLSERLGLLLLLPRLDPSIHRGRGLPVRLGEIRVRLL